jgi:hypothetical protein
LEKEKGFSILFWLWAETRLEAKPDPIAVSLSHPSTAQPKPACPLVGEAASGPAQPAQRALLTGSEAEPDSSSYLIRIQFKPCFIPFDLSPKSLIG